MPREFIYALAWVKQATARVNVARQRLQPRTAWAIERAAAEVIQGLHDDVFAQFVWRSGHRARTDAKFDQLLARRASALLGAGRGAGARINVDGQLNHGQDGAEIFAITTRVASVMETTDRLLPALERLRTALSQKAEAIRASADGSQSDCAPAQRLVEHAAQLAATETRIRQALPALHQLSGTGQDASEFVTRIATALTASLGHRFIAGPCETEAPAAGAALSAEHAALRALASNLTALATELASLPSEGPAETTAARGNAAACDAMTTLCRQVMANDVSLNLKQATRDPSHAELQPSTVGLLLQSLRLLTDGMRQFVRDAVEPIETAPCSVMQRLERSLMLVTALVPHIGYRKAAEVARKAHAERTSLREAAIALGFASPAQFDRWVQRDR